MGDNVASNKRLAKNSVFLSVRMFFVLIIYLYLTKALLETLGIDDYGVFNVICGFVSLFSFFNISLSNGVQRFYNYELGKNGVEGANKVYNTSLIIQSLLALILVIIIEIFGGWYVTNKMVIPDGRYFAAQCIFQFIVISVVFNIIQTPYIAAVMAHEKMDFYALMSIVDVVLKLIIVLILPYLNGDHLILYGLFWMFASILNLALYYLYCRNSFDEIKFRKIEDVTLLKLMLGFSGWNMFGTVSNAIKEQGLNLILNLFFGPAVNAARGVSSQINGGIQSFVQTITTPVNPQVIQAYAQGNINRTMNLTYSISKLSCYFITLIALPICYELDYILKLWLGDNVPEYTRIFTIIIIICSYQGNLNAAISSVVHATGEMSRYQFCCGLIRVFSIPIGYILLKCYMKPEFALLAIFVFDWIGHIWGLFILRTLIVFSIKDYVRKVLFPIIMVISISCVMLYPIHIYVYDKLICIIVMIIINTFTILITAYYIGFENNERELINTIIKTIIRKIK